jgi:hypothetical protein
MAPPPGQPGGPPPGQPGMAPPPGQPGMAAATTGSGLATLTRPYPQEVNKLQGILALVFGLHIFLIIVPAIKLWIYSIISWVYSIIAWFKMLLGGGKYPQDKLAWQIKFIRYYMRFLSFARCVTSEKPGELDDENHPIQVHIPTAEKISIVQLLFAPFLILPQAIVGYFYIGVYGGIMNLIAIIQVITGGKPGESQLAILQKCDQQMVRLMAYMMWLTDEKPPVVPE